MDFMHCVKILKSNHKMEKQQRHPEPLIDDQNQELTKFVNSVLKDLVRSCIQYNLMH